LSRHGHGVLQDIVGQVGGDASYTRHDAHTNAYTYPRQYSST
jgi:hypothetical protein